MLTETKLFFFLLLSGAIATECVVPKEGGKYYIKIKGADNKYGYAFGDSEQGENKCAQLHAWKSINIPGVDNSHLQEFTFKDNTLFAEIKGKDDKPLKYFVGLKQQGVKHPNLSMPKWDKKLYVSQAKTKGILRSQKVELKSDKSIVFGSDQSHKVLDPQVVLKIEDGDSYLPENNNKLEIENANNFTTKPRICFVTKKTATKDYVTLVEDVILKQQQTVLDQEPPMMKEVLRNQLKKQLTSLEVPFSGDKTEVATSKAKFLFHGVNIQKEELENSDEIKKMIANSETPKDDLFKEHLMNYKASVKKDFKENTKENSKVDSDAFNKLVLSKINKEKLISKIKEIEGGVMSPKIADGGKDAAEAEVKTAKEDSGKKSVAVASAFAAILFLL